MERNDSYWKRLRSVDKEKDIIYSFGMNGQSKIWQFEKNNCHKLYLTCIFITSKPILANKVALESSNKDYSYIYNNSFIGYYLRNN